MPNWAYTTIMFTGKEKDLVRFYKDFLKAQKKVKDGADGWIGRLLVYKLKESADNPSVHCRGFYQDIELDDDKQFVRLDVEDAWGPMEAAYDKFAEIYNLTHVFTSEEPGCELYINTDKEGKFFPERYIAEGYIQINNVSTDEDILLLSDIYDTRYFVSFDDIKGIFKNRNKEIETLDEANIIIEMIIDNLNNEEDEEFSMQIYQYSNGEE